MPNGELIIYASVADQAAPLAGVRITVSDEAGGVLARLTTDASGATEALPLSAPEAAYSLDADNHTVRPYAVYRISAEAEGWLPQILDGVQVFAAQRTVARLEFLPDDTQGSPTLADARSDEQNVEVVTIPPHPLFVGGGGSGPTPEEVQPRVLSEVVIPQKITVHLGKPSANVSNVTVGFQEYIANVASSEVYPTCAGYCLPHRRMAAAKICILGPSGIANSANCSPAAPANSPADFWSAEYFRFKLRGPAIACKTKTCSLLYNRNCTGKPHVVLFPANLFQ